MKANPTLGHFPIFHFYFSTLPEKHQVNDIRGLRYFHGKKSFQFVSPLFGVRTEKCNLH